MRQITALVCALCSFVAIAQNCDFKLTGTIKDFHDGTPIAGAAIYMKNLDKYATSDANGYYEIEGLCKGNLILEISHLACETKTLELIIIGNMVKEITLEHHVEALGEVQVDGVGQRLETVTGQESKIESEVLEKYSALTLGDAVKEISGVQSLNTGNVIAKPIINGFHSSRVAIYSNGVRLQDQEWGIEHAPNIDINSASSISVVKGSSALALAGDAIGGVIILKPKRIIKKDSLFGTTILNGQTNGRGGSISSKLHKTYETGWYADGVLTYKRFGDFEAPDYNLTNTGLDSKAFAIRGGKNTFETGFELYYSYVKNEIGILRSAHIGSVFDLIRAINSGQPFVVDDFSYDINVPKQEITHHTAKANYYKRFQNFGKVNIQYDYQNNKRFEFDVRIGDRRNIPAIDLRLQTHSLKADVNLDANLDRKINFGVLGRFQDNFANPDTGIRRFIPDYEKYDFGVYISTEWRLNDNLIADAGARYDFSRVDAKKFYRKSRWEERGYDIDFADIIIEELPTQFLTNPVFNYHNFSGSIGAKYVLNDQSHIIANYALSSRPPNPAELFSDGLHQSAARFELGDIRFDKEVANRVALSYAYNTSKLNLLTEVFYNRVNNFIYLRPFDFLSTIRGPYPLWEYQQTDAEMFGIDLSVGYELNDALYFQNRTSFLKGNDLDMNIPLIDIPPFNTTNKITYNNEKWSDFSATLTSEWVFEQNEYPDFNFEVLEQLDGEMVNVDISTPPPAYHLMHFSSEATLPLNHKTSLNVALGVNNLFDTSYRNYLNRLRFFADDLGRNFTLRLQLNY